MRYTCEHHFDIVNIAGTKAPRRVHGLPKPLEEGLGVDVSPPGNHTVTAQPQSGRRCVLLAESQRVHFLNFL